VTSGDQGFFESSGVHDVDCVGECHGFNPTRVTLVLAAFWLAKLILGLALLLAILLLETV